MTRRTVLALPLLVFLPACKGKNVMAQAVALAPALKASIDAVEAALHTDDMTPLKAGLEAVKRGIDVFVAAGKAYLADPTVSNLTATIAAVDAFLVEFDKLTIPNNVKPVAHVASIGLHFVAVLVAQIQTPGGIVVARTARSVHTRHVTDAELQEFGRSHGLEKYVK